MKRAVFFHSVDPEERTVKCVLCAHECLIKDGRRGLCRVRENRAGVLYSLVYGNLVSENVDPIEKKPLFHLLPGSKSYSIATVGCNFRCHHCQNHEISQYPHAHYGSIVGRDTTPEQVVERALAAGCESISYTYIEPTVFFEFAYDTAVLARNAGLKNVFVSNGYTGIEATRTIAPFLDANNIDLKAFSDRFYKEVCGARLQPVLDSIVVMKELGVWVEVTTLVIPGWNDSDEELTRIARFIKKVDPEMPWHVSRFHPTYRMTDRKATPVETLHRAREIGLGEGLHYVYVGNIHDNRGESTFCPQCREVVIARRGFTLTENKVRHGRCGFCDRGIAGVFE